MKPTCAITGMVLVVFGRRDLPRHMQCLLLFGHSVVFDSLQPHGLQHARLPCPSSSPGACSNSYPLSQWCHPTISSSVIPFSSCLQSFPASESFPMTQLSKSSDQNIGALTSASVLPVNIQDWFPLGLTYVISLQSKETSDSVSKSLTKVSLLNCFVSWSHSVVSDSLWPHGL